MHKTSGEVAAIAGYIKQYNIFAVEIYAALLSNDIELIELASNDSGKLDDVLIVSKSKVTAYQVKDIGSSNFTYASFTGSKPESILKGCFNGWLKLRKKYPGKKIDARLITNQSASDSDKINSYALAKKASFKSFKINFWDKVRDSTHNQDSLPKAWLPVFTELLSNSDATATELIDFIRDFNFVFDYSAMNPEMYDDYTWNKRIADIDKISKQIPNIIASKGAVTLTKEEFLREFGLTSRYETYFRHSFFVDDNHYQPISETISELNRALNVTDKGYVALIGTAGSGKSTLLTKWLKQKKQENSNDKVIKYYAYVNKDMAYDSGYRGEAKLFLQDVLIQIREGNFVTQDRLPTDDVQDLQKHLREELQKLSQTDGKTFIVVDGLDHIEREQKVSRNLIDILPPPDTIPDNIIFILGTRTIENLDNLPERILQSAKVITMQPLSFTQAMALLTSHSLTLDNNLARLLHENTKGHPLFLRYTIEELLGSSPTMHNDIIIQKDFKGDIFLEYEIFWSKNKQEENFIRLLGIMSRFRYSYIDIALLEKFDVTRQDAQKIKKLAEHYFYKINGVWQFFHNSFKEFLISESAKGVLTDQFDRAIDQSYHYDIYVRINAIDNEYRWNTIYHLFKADKFAEVLEHSSEAFFRSQWFAYREPKYILEDIHFYSIASYKERNHVALLGSFLSAYELKQRLSNFVPRDNYEIFHDLNMADIANSFIFNNVELLVDNYTALHYALSLYFKGYKDLAFDILKKAEPSYILDTSKQVSSQRYDREKYESIDEIELLVKWAQIAIFYSPFSYILGKVKDIKIVEEYERHEERSIIDEIAQTLISTCIELEDWHKLKEIMDELKKELPPEELYDHHFDIVYYLRDEDPLYKESLAWLSNYETAKLSGKRLTKQTLVEVLINKNFQKGQVLFLRIKAPDTIEKSRWDINSNMIEYIYNYSRLYYLTSGNWEHPASGNVPTMLKRTLRAFYIAVAELGRSSALITSGKPGAPFEIRHTLYRIFPLFHHHILEQGYEFVISQNQNAIIELVLEVAKKDSPEFFREILTELGKEWEGYPQYWKDEQMIQIIDFVITTGVDNQWAEQKAKKVNESLFDYGYVEQRIENAKSQIKLWAALNKVEEGEKILKKIMSVSLDVRGEKDYQIDYLMDWMDKISDPIGKDIEFYLKRLSSIADRTNSGSDVPAQEVLRLSLGYGNAFSVFEYLIFNGLVKFNDALEIVVSYFVARLAPLRKMLIKLFARSILNYGNVYSDRLMFFKSVFDANPSVEELALMVKEIKIYAITEQKDNLLSHVNAHTVNRGISIESIGSYHIEPKENSNTPSNLRLADGTIIGASEVAKQIKSYGDVLKFMEAEEPGRYFDWIPILSVYISNIRSAQLQEILTLNKFDIRGLCDIAEMLMKEGRNDEAKALANKALDMSTPNGWTTFYDGGSKIKPYTLLMQLDNRQVTQDRIFKDFAESADLPHSSLLGKVGSILEMTTENPDYANMYQHINNYRDELFSTYSIDETTPSVLGTQNDIDFIGELLVFLISFPNYYDDMIFQALIEEFETTFGLAEKVLRRLYEDGDFLKYLKFLAALCYIDSEFVKAHSEYIAGLTNNDRYDIYRLSSDILQGLGIPYLGHSITVPLNSIPFAYTMHYESKPGLIISDKERYDRLDKTGYLPETEDPMEYVNLYRREISILSKETGFAQVNIACRVRELGKYNSFPEWCRNLSEAEIREIYDKKFDLKIPYKRPRNQKVWQGLMSVVKELFDLHLIDVELADMLSNSYDPKVYFIAAEPRPKFIRNIIENTGYAPSTSEKWVHELTDQYLNRQLEFSVDNDTYILAENSIITGQGHGNSREHRQAYVGYNLKADNSGELLFHTCYQEYIDYYSDVEGPGLVLFNWVNGIDIRRNWIAFNPMAAKAIGLHLSNDGNFRWVDNNGITVVESIYWKDNDVGNRSRNLHSEAGYGWYVTITRDGLHRLAKVTGKKSLYHHKKIFRKLTFIQTKYDTYINEENTIYKEFVINENDYL